uniref:G_PROTEIN_RECEP_F2_4 domain-containing protein n=1 Tax=Parastrongyloides trichosuri TaxID=131310 RepID=A0A0N4ZF50_PARTI
MVHSSEGFSKRCPIITRYINMKFITIVFCTFFWLTKGNTFERAVELPHCSKVQVMEGEIKETDDMGRNVNIFSISQLQMSLHDTACLSISNNGTNDTSILHTIQYLRLEQHYPIIGSYDFAIPSVSTNCICDCAGGDQICSLSSYHYKNCTVGSLCYRTYHPSQSNVGCLGSEKSEVCCDVVIEPYNNWNFKAIKVKQPDTILVFRYKIFERIRQRWRLSSDDILEVPLNRGGAKFELVNYNKIEITVTGGRPHRQLEPGVFFYQQFDRFSPPIVKGNIPINDINENSLDKLGWMRKEDGKWNVRKGQVKITQAQHINVQDCKLQRYLSTLNAEQYVSVGDGNEKDENINLGNLLTDETWLESVSVKEDGRVMKIVHSEGIGILGSVKTEFKPLMLTHSSQFASFNGTIQLDKESNRFLNITFHEAKGTVIGMVYSSENKANIDIVFSVLIDGTSTREFNCIITVPGSVNSSRYVCFHPAGDVRGQQCSWLQYKSVPIPVYTVPHRWVSGKGDCENCNERGVDYFTAKLDPRTWFKGIYSFNEVSVIIFESVMGILLIAATVLIFTKCIIPIIKCGICIATPLPTKRLRRMLRINEEEDCDACLLQKKRHRRGKRNSSMVIASSLSTHRHVEKIEDADEETQFFMDKFSQGDMILFNITRAILARSLFIIHSILTIWQTVKIRDDTSIWTFALISISIVVEGSHTIIMRVGDERKWFSPSVALYIAATAPPIWLMETKMCEWRKEDELGRQDGLYLQLIEQLLLVVLIIGRWMLPKGEISREQLSQILLAYLAISSDIVEFFDVFKEKVVYTNYTVQLLVLGAWTLSLLQFPFILTNSRARKMRVAITEDPTINFNNISRKRMQVIYDIDIWAIILANGLQDIPFLCVRLFLILQHGLVTYTMMFFICKNALIIALQTYRGFVLFNDRYLGKKIDRRIEMRNVSEQRHRKKRHQNKQKNLDEI